MDVADVDAFATIAVGALAAIAVTSTDCVDGAGMVVVVTGERSRTMESTYVRVVSTPGPTNRTKIDVE